MISQSFPFELVPFQNFLKVASKFGSSEISFSSCCLLACISSCFLKSNSLSEREVVDDVSLTDIRDCMFSLVSFILEKFYILMAMLTMYVYLFLVDLDLRSFYI